MKPSIYRRGSVIFLLLIACVCGCDPESPSSAFRADSQAGQLVSSRSSIERAQTLPVRSPQSILIASFNIQVLGEAKMKDTKAIERIVEVIRQFDIVAIQEIRAKDQTLIPRLLGIINSKGARYDYVIGTPLGRSNIKEQYAFVYDSNTVVTNPNATYTVEDKADLLHREPLVARFVTRVPPNVRPFSFSLVNIHTDPDEVKDELPIMHTVLKGIREFEYLSAAEDDVLLMGDLNASPSQFGTLGKVPGIRWTVNDEPTNTRRTQIYDNMLFDRDLTNEFTGRAGVLDLCQMFGINTEEALRISDHLPIWAEFTSYEQAPNAAGRFVSGAGAIDRR
jgi:endonuclease/exonuclease/phosphatase family metal-dependent hydrolase